MASKLGTIISDFQTQLATELAVNDTTGNLYSTVDDDGVTLPNGKYFFTIDGDNSQKEHIACTLTGTVLSDIKSVSRQGVETVGVKRKHRTGATVTITDYKYIKEIQNLLDGSVALDASKPLKYDAVPSITDDAELATKKYVDETTTAGAPDASTSTKGISKLSVAPVSHTNPIVVGDNDGRVPTQDENDALVGTSGIQPNSSNKFVDDGDTTGTGKIKRESVSMQNVFSAPAGEDITYSGTPIPVYYGNGDSSIVFDGSVMNGGAAQAAYGEVSATITVGNHSNRILLAQITVGNPGTTTITCVSGATNQTLTNISGTNFYYLLNPLVGQTTVKVAMNTGSSGYSYFADIILCSYFNVEQIAPSVTKTSTVLGSLLVSMGRATSLPSYPTITGWNGDILYNQKSYAYDFDVYSVNYALLYMGDSGVLSVNKTISPSVDIKYDYNSNTYTTTNTPSSICLTPASGLSRQLFIAKADDLAKTGVVGFIKSSVTKGNVVDFQSLSVTGFSGLTEGNTYYLTDSGGVATTAGTNSKVVGRAVTSTIIVNSL